MSYSETAKRDFIPMNLRLGPRFTYNWTTTIRSPSTSTRTSCWCLRRRSTRVDSSGNADTWIPRPGEFIIASGKNPDVGVAQGMFQSFSDAPGWYNGDGELVSGSKTKEEFREINLAVAWSTGTPSSSRSGPGTSGSTTPRATASTSPRRRCALQHLLHRPELPDRQHAAQPAGEHLALHARVQLRRQEQEEEEHGGMNFRVGFGFDVHRLVRAVRSGWGEFGSSTPLAS
jgi:hypothetical protein